MVAPKLRVGIIGIGWYALSQHVPNLRATGRAEVVAISRRNAEALAAAKDALAVENAYTDWRALLERSELDAVVVSTAHHAHAEPTLAALERGLHVLVEKPMALSSRDAWAMTEAAQRADRVLMVGYTMRCEGLWRTAKRLLDEGAIGRIRQLSLTFCDDYRWMWESDRIPPGMQKALKSSGMPDAFLGDGRLEGNWRRNPHEMGGGQFVDAGAHMVDLALWLAGAPAGSVVAMTERAGLPVDCFVSAQARLLNGAMLSLNVAAGVAGASPRFLTVIGDRGVLGAEWDWRQREVWLERDGRRETVESRVPDTTPAAAFVAAVMDGAENPAPAEDGAHAVAFSEAAYRSDEERRIVDLAVPGMSGAAHRPAVASPA